MSTCTEHRFTTHDGAEIFYRAWAPETPSRSAVLVFHRGHEHSGRMLDLVKDLGLREHHIFAWDCRGHGKSPGARGSAENLAVIVQDADCFARHLAQTHGIPLENMALVAHSVGAAIAAAWVHDYAPPLRGMVLAAPAFRVKLYVPLAIPALRLRQKLFGPGYVKSYVKARVLTHDPAQAEAYGADPEIFSQIAVNILLDLHDTSRRVVADAGAITVPALVLAAERDWVVQRRAQEDFYRGLSSPRKEFCVLPGFFHAVFHEKERQLPIGMCRDFLRRQFEAPAAPLSLRGAHRGGYTRTEFDLLRAPEGFSRWSLVRGAMGTVGRLSRGIRLGWERGFDSGETLDYVYANTPQGTTPLGRLMDKAYLESIGWRGIRLRKLALEHFLRRAMQETHQRKAGVHIVDIATGVGRYVLDALQALPEVPATALLRDYKEANLESGRRLAEARGMGQVRYEWGDAFDREGLARLQPGPDIGIVSGLFELIPDNDLVMRALEGLAAASAPGTFLIYTNQPWHPQLEFIAKVLTNREGEPWIMRRRTQAEMDELVRLAGYDKLDMRIDPWGIFSVSLAVRRRP